MDLDVFLDHLFSLLDEAFLQGLDLQKKLKRVGVSSLELAPSVIVQGVLKLFRQGLDLQSFFLEGVAQSQHLLFELGDL